MAQLFAHSFWITPWTNILQDKLLVSILRLVRLRTSFSIKGVLDDVHFNITHVVSTVSVK